MAVGAAVWNNWNWGHCDWRSGSVNINNNFNFSRNLNTGNINVGNRIGGGNYSKWEHNVAHRGGVRYRDGATQAKFTNARLDSTRQMARIDQGTARGFDRAGGDAQRRSDITAQRPGGRDTPRAAPSDVKRAQSLDRGRMDGQLADRGGGSSRRASAFNMSNGGFDRAASQRGSASRGASGGRRGGGRGR
jgi:hypothetical protein